MHISLAWNVEFIFYYYGIIKKFGFDRDLRFILRHPKILHFTWKPKPWETSCQHPFRINYYRYLKKIKRIRFLLEIRYALFGISIIFAF